MTSKKCLTSTHNDRHTINIKYILYTSWHYAFFFFFLTKMIEDTTLIKYGRTYEARNHNSCPRFKEPPSFPQSSHPVKLEDYINILIKKSNLKLKLKPKNKPAGFFQIK